MTTTTTLWIRRTAMTIIAILVAAYPFVSNNFATWQLSIQVCYYLLVVLSWNAVSGFAGLFSFGHVAFAVIGAYGSAILAEHGVALPFAMLLGGLMAGAAGALLGLLSLRLRGPYLVVVSFSFLGFVQIFIKSDEGLTGGASGMASKSLFLLSQLARPYILGLVLVALFLIAQHLLLRSHWYEYLVAIRDNEFAAAALGGHPRRWKIVTFAGTAAVAGIAGAFYGQALGFIQPGMGDVSEMSYVVAFGMIGGLGTVIGPIVATIGLLVVDYQLRNASAGLTELLFGAALLAVITLFPRGLSGIGEQVVPFISARFGRRNGSGRDRHDDPRTDAEHQMSDS